MPHYEYVCQACNKKFSVVLTIEEHDKGKIKCPKCGSSTVEQQWAAFFATTSKKSQKRVPHDMEFNSPLAANNGSVVLTVRDAAKYRALLVAKREELARGVEGPESLVPPANDRSGDLIDCARADTEAELHVRLC